MGCVHGDEIVFRSFLNKGKDSVGLAAVSSSYQEGSYDDGKTWYTSAAVSISDCNRVVELDFGANETDVDEKITKAEILKTVFENMIANLKCFKEERVLKTE